MAAGDNSVLQPASAPITRAAITEMRPDFHVRALWNLNAETLERLHGKGLLCAAPVKPEAVIDLWLFPLFSVDLDVIRVNPDDLRAARDEYWYREMGV